MAGEDLISTPVSYIRQGTEVRVLTRSTWWKNVTGGKPVSLRIQGKDYQGTANVIDDPQAVSQHMQTVLQQQPMNARFFKVTFQQNGSPNPDEVAEAAKTAKLVVIYLR